MQKYVAITDHKEIVLLGSFENMDAAEVAADADERTADNWLIIIGEDEAQQFTSAIRQAMYTPAEANDDVDPTEDELMEAADQKYYATMMSR